MLIPKILLKIFISAWFLGIPGKLKHLQIDLLIKLKISILGCCLTFHNAIFKEAIHE
jgi:hypothetical protein